MNISLFLQSKLNVRSLPKKLFLKVLTKVLSEIFLISVEMGAVELKLKLDVWWRGVRCEPGGEEDLLRWKQGPG